MYSSIQQVLSLLIAVTLLRYALVIYMNTAKILSQLTIFVSIQDTS